MLLGYKTVQHVTVLNTVGSCNTMVSIIILKKKNQRYSSPITGPRCPDCSRTLRFPDYVAMAQNGGKVVSLTHRPFLPPGNAPGTHFCYRLS